MRRKNGYVFFIRWKMISELFLFSVKGLNKDKKIDLITWGTGAGV